MTFEESQDEAVKEAQAMKIDAEVSALKIAFKRGVEFQKSLPSDAPAADGSVDNTPYSQEQMDAKDQVIDELKAANDQLKSDLVAAKSDDEVAAAVKKHADAQAEQIAAIEAILHSKPSAEESAPESGSPA